MLKLRFLSWGLGCAVLGFAGACAHRQTATRDTRVNLGETAYLNLGAVNEILPPVQLVQVLTVDYAGKKRSSQVVLEARDGHLKVTALMPFGGEAFRIEYTGGEITSRSLPLGADSLDLKFALADVILVYAPRAVLLKWLSPGVQVVDSPGHRVLRTAEKTLIEIDYGGADPLAAEIHYRHLLRNYRIHIKPVSQRKL